MTQTLRVFVAIELPSQVEDALSGVVQHLERARINGLRTVRADRVHLTLKFLGEVPEVLVSEIIDEMAQAVVKQDPFTLVFGGFGAFPSEAKPRVLWVAVQGDLSALLELQDAVEGALERMGIKRERRRFDPHLTVARIREGATGADRQRAVDTLLSTRLVTEPRFTVDSVSLIRSILQAGGASYRCLARMPLTGTIAK